jgi:hypothetical protein
MKIRATYFKEGGKFYAEGDTTIPDFTSPWEISTVFLGLVPPPGLSRDSAWDGPILLDSPGDDSFPPILIPGCEPLSRSAWLLKKKREGRPLFDPPKRKSTDLEESIAAFVHKRNRFTTTEVAQFVVARSGRTAWLVDVESTLLRLGFAEFECARAPYETAARREWRRTR